MYKRAFIIHGWEGDPSLDWYPWLKHELTKKGYEVHVPAMPDTDAPEINTWVDKLTKVVGIPDEQTYLIGHSIGCQAILRYLSQLFDVHIAATICVAPWFSLQGLESQEERSIARPWLETPIDFNKARNATTRLVSLFSDNDPFVPLQKNKALCEQQLGAEVMVLDGKGHFTDEEGVTEIPELLLLL